MKEKINQLINNSVNQIKPKLQVLDLKLQGLIPNPKLRKILYYSVVGLFGFMFLLMVLGIILTPFRNTSQKSVFSLNKPKIVVPSPIVQPELNENQKQLYDMENKIKNLKFPESILTIPTIESNLTI